VDDLAIFKVSAIGNGCAKLYDPDTDKTISASIGSIKKTDKTGASVASLKLLAQATGEYTRDELNKVAKLSWTDKAAAEIAAAKAAVIGGGGGSDNSGGNGSQNSGSQNGGTEQGGSETGGGSNSESVKAPVISGETPFDESTEVSISGPDGAEIRYTTDGTAPNAESSLYSEAITLTDTATVKAIAIKNGESSEAATKVFTKNGSNVGSGGFETGN